VDNPPFLCRLSSVQQTIVTPDLEGVLVPEIWIAFAEKTGIDGLRLTTRDVKQKGSGYLL
jgi:hypothetical protein